MSDGPTPPRDPGPSYPPPSSPKGLLVLIGLALVVGLIAWLVLKDAWPALFPGT